MNIKIAGIDGCKHGWVVASGFIDGGSLKKISLELIPHLSFAFLKTLQTVAIDNPIGLPRQTRSGGRQAEKEARAILKKRSATLFSTPCRDCLKAESYPEALDISRHSSPENIGISKQSYYILPKIKELDKLLQTHPSLRNHIVETHPELSFYEILGLNMPLNSKHKLDGRSARLNLLEEHGLSPGSWLPNTPIIDQIDALACLWSAHRVYLGTAKHVPTETVFDATGLEMSIYW